MNNRTQEPLVQITPENVGDVYLDTFGSAWTVTRYLSGNDDNDYPVNLKLNYRSTTRPENKIIHMYNSSTRDGLEFSMYVSDDKTYHDQYQFGRLTERITADSHPQYFI